MRHPVLLTGFVWLHLIVGGLVFATAVPTVVLLADLWMPDHTGMFVVDGRLVGAGILASPRGMEVHAGWLRPVAASLAMVGMSGVVGVHQAGLRVLLAVSNGFRRGLRTADPHRVA